MGRHCCCSGEEDMTVSQELREWAMCDRQADVNNLSYSAWYAMTGWRTESRWSAWFGSDDHRRTFALFVACAMEDDA